MTKIEFSFLCKKKFVELDGEDYLTRNCGDCQREVINLEALTPEEAGRLSEIAIDAGLELCVAVTVRQRIEARTCKPSYSLFGRVGGQWLPHRKEPIISPAEGQRRVEKLLQNVRQERL